MVDTLCVMITLVAKIEPDKGKEKINVHMVHILLNGIVPNNQRGDLSDITSCAAAG